MNIGNNIGNIMKITGAWNTFKSNHQVPGILSGQFLRKGLKRKEAIIEIAITTPEERR